MNKTHVQPLLPGATVGGVTPGGCGDGGLFPALLFELPGATPGAVSQWLKRGRLDGVGALRPHPAHWLTPKLTTEQRTQVPALLERGPEASGFRGQL